MSILASTTTIADAFSSLLIGEIPFRFTAYDGSSAGPEDSTFGLHLKNERGLSYLVTAPGDLGLARAYVMGDLELVGAHPGDPFAALSHIKGSKTG
ncbi:MAG: SAM-dependent methyltransferase, partial [Marmoricola sp.]